MYSLSVCFSQGGMPGAERLRDSQALFDLLKRHVDAGNLHAAICATPAVALESRGYLKGKKATSHPGFVEKLADSSEAERRVVVDGMLTTSRGPGTAFEFALSLVQQLYGDDKMREVAKPMVMYDGWEDSVAQANVAGVP
jgi:4-methyl-5(b-hydroxyethyl)-thiazole monophosphate biosynthesis